MKWDQLKKIKLKDVLNPYKWMSAIRGYGREDIVPMHELEQIMMRSLICAPCVERGYCDGCGCTMPSKIYDPNAMCDTEEYGYQWGPMMDKDTWENYKIDHKLNFIYKYS